MRPRRRSWRWRPLAPDGHWRSPDPHHARSPALGTLPRHCPRLSPQHLSTPPRNRPHRDGQRQDAGAAIARKDGRGYGFLLGGAPRSQSRRLAAEARHSGRLRWPSVPSHSPPLNARYGHPRAMSIVGLTSPLAMKVRNIALCIRQRAYGRREDLLLDWSGARRPSGFAQGGGVPAAAQTRGPGPFAS